MMMTMQIGVRMAVMGVVLALGAAGCSRPSVGGAVEGGAEGGDEVRGTGGTWVYRCAEERRFAATFGGDSVWLTIDERRLTLPQVAAASGARYSAGGYTFWGRGTGATLTTPEGVWEGCSGEAAETVWAAARMLGYDFRGIGQEPGWLVEIDADRRIHLLLDYGERVIVTAAPERTESAGAVEYRAASAQGEVRVRIAPEVCADVMSGEEYPNRVTATVGGATYEGCGRLLDGRAETRLTATRWTVQELGGQPVDPAGAAPPDLQLDDATGRISGNSGCNRYFGTFVREGEQLRFPAPIGSTRRACADPRGNELERRYLEMLGHVVRYRIEEGALVLYAADGQALARLAGP